MRIVFFGLSITSSWGNGHATTYRGMVRELVARGHAVLFLERDKPWYRGNADLPSPPWGETRLYESLDQLRDRFGGEIANADCVIVGSYVPDGIAVGEWVTSVAQGRTAFYDIDTPVTLAAMRRQECFYIDRALVGKYGIYFSFTGGQVLERIEREFGSPRARALYCSVDPEVYFPEERKKEYDLGYLGTYSADRQPTLNALLIEVARQCPDSRFAVAGPQYPNGIEWPANVRRIAHLAPRDHRDFYNGQRATLNVTRADMIAAGWSPSVRLFEAAACATPVISDWWPGLDELFVPGEEILIARETADVRRLLQEMPQDELAGIGRRARERVLKEHTAAHRAMELEQHLAEAGS
jgi:spore maturation protein CgeB